MKEKYFSTIRNVGILLTILTWLACIIPYVGYITDGGVGLPHTIVSYYRFQTAEELKSSTKIGESLNASLGEKLFEKLVEDISKVFRDQEITKWNKETRKKTIPGLLDNTEISSYQSIIEKAELEELLVVVMQKEKVKVYRNWNIGAVGDVSPDENSEFYTSLVMMSLAFFVSIYSVLKYGKDSKIRLGITFLVASLLGAASCLCNEIRLENTLNDVTWPAGAKVWTIGPFIAGITYGLLLIYALAVVVIDIKGRKKIG